MKGLTFFMAYLALAALSLQIQVTNSRTSTLWKLNPEEGKIQGYAAAAEEEKRQKKDTVNLTPTPTKKYKVDEVFHIISSTIVAYGSSWSKQSLERNCDSLCESVDDGESVFLPPTTSTTLGASNSMGKSGGRDGGGTLDCGKPVNFTYYDYLIGVAQRYNHPVIPDPGVAYLFLKNKDDKSFKNFDINALEKRLRRTKKENARSVQTYNQIGNFWRIKGDARQSIECFRRALAIAPTNAEVLLNLAGLLYNLQYLDDAIHLTRRSLEVQPPDRSAWRQYFTLGEIFKSYGHFHESLLHLRHALELFPHHEPILKSLRDVENSPSSPLHFYTWLIIIGLIIAVFIVVISTTDSLRNSNQSAEFEPKAQRHFNRAMAMRSLKGLSSRNFKHRRF